MTKIMNDLKNNELFSYLNDEETDVQMGIFVNHDTKRIVVAFRGTDSIRDWRFNLQFCKYRIRKDRRLHRGFCEQLFRTNVYFRTIRRLNNILILCPDYNVYVTGHSAGGALATIFSYFCSDEIHNKHITVVTFASPRICNYEFKQDFESRSNLKHYQVTSQNDLITYTPMYRYYHVGERILLKSHLNCCCFVKEHNCDMYLTNLSNTVWYSGI